MRKGKETHINSKPIEKQEKKMYKGSKITNLGMISDPNQNNIWEETIPQQRDL